MGIFGNKKESKERPVAFLTGDTSFSFDEVVGESFYREVLLAIIAESTPEEQASGEVYKKAVVGKEPNNPHDPNAILVLIAGEPVGHIAKEMTAELHRVIAVVAEQGYNDFAFACDAVIGWNANRDDAPIGVRLDLVVSRDTDEDDA